MHAPEYSSITDKSLISYPSQTYHPMSPTFDGQPSDLPPLAITDNKLRSTTPTEPPTYCSSIRSYRAPNLQHLFILKAKGARFENLAQELKLWMDRVHFLKNEFLDLIIFFVGANQISQGDYKLEKQRHTAKVVAAENVFAALKITHWQNVESQPDVSTIVRLEKMYELWNKIDQTVFDAVFMVFYPQHCLE